MVNPAADAAPRILISYSHDSPEHVGRVRALSDQLREHGIDANIDLYEPHPPQSWPVWMEQQIEAADFVLIVFTETYHKRATAREVKGKGKGVAWESLIIRNGQYNGTLQSSKLVPVLFDVQDEQYIHSTLSGSTRHLIGALNFDDAEYEKLYRRLTNQPEVERPQLGPIKRLPAKVSAEVSWPAANARTGRSDTDTTARRRYLEILRKDLENRRSVSIHRARFIDLGIEDTPDATHLPWMYRDPDSAQEFHSFSDAFSKYGRRLLLLGAPGSGKTTTLQHIAEQLVEDAVADPTAPIPILANLSKFQFKTSAMAYFRKQGADVDQSLDDQIEQWLITELTQYPGISRKIAGQWIASEQIAVLLDGLDEVDDDFRSDLVQLLNDTFLRTHPDITVVVCSRIYEYSLLRDRPETKLQLGGAVTLQSLSDKDIAEYLAKAQALGLRDALGNDQQLYQMAQTPLTLSMMTLAYGELTAAEVPSYASLTAQRHHLMEAYVEKALQRNRNTPVPLRANECKYSPKEVNKYLGWLAVRMSVRMQTSFSLERFYGFLATDMKNEGLSSTWWIFNLIRTLPIVFCTLILGLILMPHSWTGFLQTATITAIVVPATLIVSALSRVAEDRTASAQRRAGYGLAAIGISALFFALGVVSRSLSVVIDPSTNPLSLTLILICLGILSIIALSKLFPRSWEKTELGLAELALAISITLILVLGGAARYWEFGGPILSRIATGLVFCLFIYGCLKVPVPSWSESLMIAGVIAGAIIFLALSVWLIGDITWGKALIALGSIGISLYLIKEAEADLLAVCLMVIAMLVGALHGPAGAVVAALAFLYLLLFFSFVLERDSDRALLKRIDETFRRAAAGYALRLDKFLFSPLILPLLGFTRRLPLRVRAFVDHAVDTMLLKRAAGSDTEFVHRLLRDYLALRDLRERLDSPDLERRLTAIRSLGFQGESAIDLLHELIRDGDERVREASVSAMSRIPSPRIIDDIKTVCHDSSLPVRRAVIVGTKYLSSSDRKTILQSLSPVDVEHLEFEFVVAVIGPLREWESDEGLDPVIKAARNPDAFVQALILALRLKVSANRRHPLRVLCKYANSNAVTFLIEMFANPRTKNREDIAEALGRLRDLRARGPLVKALSDREPKIRYAAAEGLGLLDDVSVVEPLIRALSDRRAGLWNGAIVALAKLRSSSTPEVCKAVQTGISALPDEKFVMLVEQLISDTILDSRQESARYRLRESARYRLRESTIITLGELKDERVIEPIVAAFKDDHPYELAQALRSIGTPRASELITQLGLSYFPFDYGRRRPGFGDGDSDDDLEVDDEVVVDDDLDLDDEVELDD